MMKVKAGEVVSDRYRLVSRLGVGGMGTVWSAEHLQTGRSFAIKIMHPAVAESEDSRKRFQKEARASARIDHPNVIDVLDVGELEDGGLFMAMELLDGLSLAEALRLEPPLSLRELLIVLRDAVSALAAAHVAGIIHRDVKPANIFLHRDRNTGFVRPKVLDFGVSKFSYLEENATHTGSLLGSPRYMSPEQARSASHADHRADIWSVGVILFEALTGRHPHEGDNFSNLVVAIATTQPKSIDEHAPHAPERLRQLVHACLSPVESRIDSAAAVASWLDALLQGAELDGHAVVRPVNKPPITRPPGFEVHTVSDSVGSQSAHRSPAYSSAASHAGPPAPAVSNQGAYAASATPQPRGSLPSIPNVPNVMAMAPDGPPPGPKTMPLAALGLADPAAPRVEPAGADTLIESGSLSTFHVEPSGAGPSFAPNPTQRKFSPTLLVALAVIGVSAVGSIVLGVSMLSRSDGEPAEGAPSRGTPLESVLAEPEANVEPSSTAEAPLPEASARAAAGAPIDAEPKGEPTSTATATPSAPPTFGQAPAPGRLPPNRNGAKGGKGDIDSKLRGLDSGL